MRSTWKIMVCLVYVLYSTSLTPNKTSATLNKTSATPNNTSATANNTSATPNKTSATLNNTSAKPNKTSATPNNTSATPNKTSATANKTRVPTLKMKTMLHTPVNLTIIKETISWYFLPARYISVVACNSSERTSSFLDDILTHLNVPVFLNSACDSINKSDNASETSDNYSEMRISYLIMGNSYAAIIDNMAAIQAILPLRNPRGNLLLMVYEQSMTTFTMIHYRDLLHRIWAKHGILNFMVLTLYPSTHEFVFFDPFFPIDKNNWGQAFYLDPRVRLDKRSTFYDKLADMKGYPVRVSMFERKYTALLIRLPRPNQTSDEYSGSDGYLLTELARYMNFSPQTSVPSDGKEFGDQSKNGTFTGAIGDILYGRADIAFNTRFIKDYGSDDVIFANQIASDHLCIVVPKAKRIPKWLTMLTSFDKSLYLLIFIMYITYPALWVLFQKCRHAKCSERKKEPDTGSIFLNTLLPFVSSSMVRLPTRGSERILIMSCILLGFLLDSMFQGKLLTTITKPMYYRDIDTLKQLDDSGLVITTGSANLNDTFVAGTGNPVMDNLKSKIRINSTGGVYERLGSTDKYAGISRKSDFLLRSLPYKTADGMPVIHLVKECPRSYYLSFMLPKRSSYLRKINEFIRRIFEAGLVTQWNEQTTFNLVHKTRDANDTTEDKKFDSLRVFSFADLQLPFFILALGHSVACSIFIIEIICRRNIVKRNIICLKIRSEASKDQGYNDYVN